ncbi:MAG: hypothetical protein LAQ30_03940 [Acidobacteriia bacterium]|nr:hypothetical protein [Terriglobia bacterium]
MYFWILAVLAIFTLRAADEQELALALKAQTDFDHVELAAVPVLRDTAACVQSQAALLPLAAREEVPLVHYRKGYCSLVGATLTHNPGEFTAAAAEFDKAIETWPDRAPAAGKDKPAEPVSSGLRVLAWIARLEAGAGKADLDRARNEMAAAIGKRACPVSLMPAAFCQAALDRGREWVGWIDLQQDDVYAAARDLSGASSSGWALWAAGKQAFADRKYGEAAARYRSGIEAWTREQRETAPALADRLKPRPDLSVAMTDLGGAQLLAGDAGGAIVTLDSAVKTDPSDARAFYLRARAKETLGQTDAALADLNLASRAAFAGAKDLASGEAHLYRGIMYYRRKDYARAEDEFASALNFDIPPALKGDAEAWRHLSAVALGSCGAARQELEQALGTVSPFFPKQEARAAADACITSTAAAGGPVNAAK